MANKDLVLNGSYAPLKNEVLEALAKVQLPGHEWRILAVIIRKTIGYNKKSDWITNGQYCRITGMKKNRVSEAYRSLKAKNLITENRNNEKQEVQFNSDFTTWEPFRKTGRFQKTGMSVPKNRNECSEKPEPTIVDITIVDNTIKSKNKKPAKRKLKKEWSQGVKDLVEFFFSTLPDESRKKREKNREKYHDCCDKLMRLDEFSYTQIKKAIQWARNDDFWSNIFLGFTYLRKKNKQDVQYIDVFLTNAKSKYQNRKQKFSSQEVGDQIKGTYDYFKNKSEDRDD